MLVPWPLLAVPLPVGGFYRYRRGGEHHGWEANLIHTLQAAVASDSYSTYKKFSEGNAKLPPATLRDLLDQFEHFTRRFHDRHLFHTVAASEL